MVVSAPRGVSLIMGDMVSMSGELISLSLTTGFTLLAIVFFCLLVIGCAQPQLQVGINRNERAVTIAFR